MTVMLGGCLAYIGPGGGIALLGPLVGVICAMIGALAMVAVWPIRAALKTCARKSIQRRPVMMSVMPWAWAIALGTIAGIASMLIYRRLSPQDRLRRLGDDIVAVRKQLNAYDGDFSGAMALTGENLRLSFRRLGCVLWPSLVSGLPVLSGLPTVGAHLVPYFLAVVVAALALKLQLKIA